MGEPTSATHVILQEDLDEELASVQHETMKVISECINVNVDTLETIERQIEQTEGDLRLLEEAKEDLDEAQKLITSIKRGLFSFGSGKPKSFNLPDKMGTDLDFAATVGGHDCLIRISVLLYQAEESGKRGSMSIPFNYISLCEVKKDGQTVEIRFHPKHYEFIGAKLWTVHLKDPERLQDFVKGLRTRVLQKGAADMQAREDFASLSRDAWAQAVFKLKFEDESQSFTFVDSSVEINQGMVTNLLEDYRTMKQTSIELGTKGKLTQDNITVLQTRGLAIMVDQITEMKGSFKHHMDLLVHEQELMINLTAQADDLTRQNEEILATNDGCCTICGCSCVVM